MPLDDQSSGFWDANTADSSYTPSAPAAPDVWYSWVPGNDTTIVPKADPAGGFDPYAVLKGVGTAANAVNSFLNTRDSLQFAAQDRSLNLLKTQAQIDLTRSQINSQAAVDQARIAAQTQIAKQQFAKMPGLTALFGGTGAPGKTDWLMLILTAAGVYYAWRAVGHHA